MKRKARLKLAGVAIVLILLSYAGYRGRRALFPQHSGVQVPAELLFPQNISVALRVNDVERAFQRHWVGRGRDDFEDATEQLLTAFGIWDEWVLAYGQRSARARIKAYKSAVFELLGKESWIVFGEWAAPGLEGTGEIALLVYVRADSPIASRIGPLANLLFPGHKTSRSEYHGVDVYEYHDSNDRHAVSLASIGGWICASVRSAGLTPITKMIDQYDDAQRTGRQAASLFPAANGGSPPSAIGALFAPGKFWGQFRGFSMKRGEPVKKGGERRLTGWAQRLEGIDEVWLEQAPEPAGGSLLNLDLTLRGRRIPNLDPILVDTKRVKTEPWDRMTSLTQTLAPSIIQADLSYPFAVDGLPLFGLDWEKLQKSLKGIKWLNPGLPKALKKVIEVDSAPHDARMGVGLFQVEGSPLPAAVLWHDKGPVGFAAESPADVWRRVTDQSAAAHGDFRFSSALHLEEAVTTSTLAHAQRQFTNSLWSEGGSPPLAFAAVNFDQLRQWMDGFPLILLSKNGREAWAHYRAIASGMELAAGSLAIRIDRQGDELILKTRALELNPVEKSSNK